MGKPEGKNHLEDLGVDGSIMLKGREVMDRINLDQGRDNNGML